MRVGRHCGIGLQSVLSATDGNDLAIGADVAIAPRCVIGGGDYYTDQLDQPMSRQAIKPGFPVVLGDDIWLGSGAVVLGGVRIGQGSIVGAGAVVTRDVAPYTVCAGVPARPLKRRTAAAARATTAAHETERWSEASASEPIE
jgi:acetyltransferase-like isoleucine patch superfamily enzyme